MLELRLSPFYILQVNLISISRADNYLGGEIVKPTCSPSHLTVGGSQRTELSGLRVDNVIGLAIEEAARKPG